MPKKLVHPDDSAEEKRMCVDEGDGTLLGTDIPQKKRKSGIVYLSSIPKRMTATILREMLCHYGEIGRMHLQEDVRDIAKPRKKKQQHKKSHSQNYSEGWVEFKSKRVAKEVARVLNNTHIGGRKKSSFYDCIWIMKYLPRFKWTHLSERLAYEQAVRKQRMRAEIYQAKCEADYFSLNMDMSEKLKKKLLKGQKLMNFDDNSPVEIYQRETEEQIIEKKHAKDRKPEFDRKRSGINVDDREAFLKNLFS